MTRPPTLDVLVIGGGIAGLWTLHRLLGAGRRAALLTSPAAASSQSLASQGIIHGGLKYLLGGAAAAPDDRLAAMPQRWRQALGGDGELSIDASGVAQSPVHLFSSGAPTARLAGLLASRSLRGRARRLPPQAYPPLFRDPGFSGSLYVLEDFAIDVPALLEAMAAGVAEQVHHGDARSLPWQQLADGSWRIGALQARQLVLAAGAGNAELLQRAAIGDVAMQRRPLHQLWMTAAALPELWAHAVTSLEREPRLTISTHWRQGRLGWSLGGALASSGVERDAETQVRQARSELHSLLPWLPLDDAHFTSEPIDRAEPLVPGGRRVDRAFVTRRDQVVVAWPTKLTLAPDLADQVLAALDDARPARAAAHS